MTTGLGSVAARLRARVPADERDRGAFAALELVLLVPFIIVMMLLVVGFGRVERGRQLVDQAAQAASRAASLTLTPGDAQTAAKQAAAQTLDDGGRELLEHDGRHRHVGVLRRRPGHGPAVVHGRSEWAGARWPAR